MIKKIYFVYILLVSFNSTIAQYASWPIGSQNDITSTFGSRYMSGRVNNYDFHGGIDIKGYAGDNVYAATDGIIPDGGISTESETAAQKGYIVVKYEGNGFTDYYRYTHITPNSSLSVGSTVKRGALIGTIYSYVRWGPHLDFRYYWNTYEMSSAVHPLQILYPYNNTPKNIIEPQSGIKSDDYGRYIEIRVISDANAPDFEKIVVDLSGKAIDGFSYNAGEIFRGDFFPNNVVDFHLKINAGEENNNEDNGLVKNIANDKIGIRIVTQDFDGVNPQILSFRFYIKEEFLDPNNSKLLRELKGTITIYDALEVQEINWNYDFLASPNGPITFTPPSGTYSTNSGIKLYMTKSIDGWIYFNKGTNYFDTPDLTEQNAQYYLKPGETYNSWSYLLPGDTYIKAKVYNPTTKIWSQQSEAKYTINLVTGVEDYINISPASTQLNQNSAAIYGATFVDVEPVGDYIVNGYDWTLNVFHSAGKYLLNSGSTGNQQVWNVNVGSLPFGYCWQRDENNNVIGEVVVTAVDNKGLTHTSNIQIKVIDINQNSNYSITGKIFDNNNQAISGVIVKTNNGIQTTRSSDGSYQFNLSCGWTGFLIAEKVGYSFEPSSHFIADIGSNTNDLNFLANKNKLYISGNIFDSSGSLIDQVQLTFSNSGGNITNDSEGFYSHQVNYSWSGAIRPNKTGYTFSPDSIQLLNITSNFTQQNFTATQITFTINGFVKDNKGNPLQNVILLFSNGGGSILTSTDGSFLKVVNYGWNGVITPQKTGYSFTPSYRDYSSVTSNYANQDFTGALLPFSISGSVKNNSGVGIAGVQIVFSNSSSIATTDSLGYYSKYFSFGWSGTAIPTSNCYTFNPISRIYSNLDSNYTNQDFIGVLGTVTISGIVKDNSNNPIEGATITYSNNGGVVTTNVSGNYTNTVSCNWSGTVTPSKANYTFNPAIISFNNVITNQTDQNFTSIPPSEYSISGTVIDNFGNPLPNVNIVFSNYGNTITNASGYYIKSLPPGWSGTIDARLSGWLFSPTSYSISNLNNVLTKNFTATPEVIISGYVRNGSGQAIANVILYFQNLSNGNNDFITQTFSDGKYQFENVPYGYSGKIVPILTGYNFIPAYEIYNNINRNITQDFRADIITFNMRGRITNNTGIPISNVTIVFSGGLNSVTTSANGEFNTQIPYGWSGTATPQKIGHSFSPANRSYSNVTYDYYSQDFLDLGTHLEIPQNLTATDLVQNGKVSLTWNPINNIGNYFSKYYIFEDIVTNPTRLIDSVMNVNQTTKTVSGLKNYVTHYFKVAVVDNDGIRGGYSNNASALPTKDTVFTITLRPRSTYNNEYYVSLPVIPYDGIYSTPQVLGGASAQGIMSNTQIWRRDNPYWSPPFNFQIGQGYYVLLLGAPPYINFVGRPLNGGVSISIPYTGFRQYYYIGYPYATSHHYASQLFNGTGVNYAEDGYGNFYVQGFGTDMLMMPGRGYAVQTYYNFTLNYPQIPYWQNVIGQQFFSSSNSSLPEEQYKGKLKFKRNGKPYAIIISKINDNTNILNEDVEIGAYDGDDCVGGVVYDGKLPLLLVVWLESRELGIKGAIKGNDIIIRPNSISGKKELAAVAKFTKGEKFASDNYSVVELTLSDKKNQNSLIAKNDIIQNYPNPFNPTTIISFQLKERDFVTLKVYDMLGREVKTLVNEEKAPGLHQVTFDATYLASGVYFYTLITKSFSQTRKMFLIK